MMTGSSEELPASMFIQRVRRRWRTVRWVLLGMFAITATIVLCLPSRYQTHLKVLVKNERVDPLVGADAQTQGIMYVNEISEARINTEIQMLTSTDVLREVVAQRHLAQLVDRGDQSQQRREEVALRELQRDLTVATVRSSNVIEATYESASPQRAAEVLRTLLQVYMSSHRMLHGAPGSYELFRDLSTVYANELATAESNLARFGKEHQIVTMPEQKTLALTNIAHLESQMEETSAAAQRSGQTALQLKRAIDVLPASVERQRRSMSNQATVEHLTAVLVGLENSRSVAVLRYKPEDRAVKELTSQIAQTEAALAAANGSKAEEISMGADPAIDLSRGEYLRVSAEEAGERAQVKELGRQLQGDRTRLMSLDAQTVAYHELQRKVSALEELDGNYRKKSEAAGMAELLDQQSISNLAVVEEPFQPILPSSPKRGLLLSLAFLWSLVVAAATAVALELFGARINSPFELAVAGGLPVLAAVPVSALPPSYDGSFPALYQAMQRRPAFLEKRRA